ncbi:MAG: XdhC family protein, partial [Sinomicrobium sp.]|nr:XdhC family protein [Sinomicrobium sp.]
MTHELKKIMEVATAARKQERKSVLATVVALDGSSYRRPGVRMLLLEDGKMIGAVSGGCVEKEVQRQAETVFKTGIPKLMTYDGRYRLGCEGVLYLLLEPFGPGEALHNAFSAGIKDRKPFEMISFYEKKEGAHPEAGSFMKFSGDRLFPLSEGKKIPGPDTALHSFSQTMTPCFKLVIL